MESDVNLLDRISKRARDIYYQRNPAPGVKPWERLSAVEQNVWKPYAEAAIEAVGEIAAHDLIEDTKA
jgi:hypothetical protein